MARRDRSSAATRLAAAGLPSLGPSPVVDSRSHPAALRILEWVGRRENLEVRGPSGTGKAMFLEALGHAAVEAGRKVAWFSLESLVGLLAVSPDAAEGLYRLVDSA